MLGQHIAPCMNVKSLHRTCWMVESCSSIVKATLCIAYMGSPTSSPAIQILENDLSTPCFLSNVYITISWKELYDLTSAGTDLSLHRVVSVSRLLQLKCYRQSYKPSVSRKRSLVGMIYTSRINGSVKTDWVLIASRFHVHLIITIRTPSPCILRSSLLPIIFPLPPPPHTCTSPPTPFLGGINGCVLRIYIMCKCPGTQRHREGE